ncbi:hypothetical protein TNCV_4285071 [Trichonephila clavipes]|nr:hypothetical protein TNCV_4285071 [Trichonephila clavipes]
MWVESSVGQRNFKGKLPSPKIFDPTAKRMPVFVWYTTRYPKIELSIASIPEDGKDPEVICITVDHSNLLTTAKDSGANRYINERISLKSHLPGSVPLEYLSFCVRGKFCHLAQGNRGLIVVKGSDQRKMFEELRLFTINLEILPHFRDLNDRTLPDHLHDEVYEDYGISECTLVKSYRFARYLQHFNKLQVECKRQTAHLIE